MAKLPKVGSGKRFSNLTKKLASKGARDPKALAGYIGRKKYGAKKMATMASKGKMMPGSKIEAMKKKSGKSYL